MANIRDEVFIEEQEKGLSDSKTFKKLWKYIKKYKIILMIALLSLTFSTIIDLMLPYLIRYGIDNVINVEYTFSKNEKNEYILKDDGIYKLDSKDEKYYFLNKETQQKEYISKERFVSYKQENINKVTSFSGIFLIVLIFQLIINYSQVFFSNLLGQKVIYDIRSDLFKHIVRVKYRFFTQNPSGKITTRIVNDTQNLSEFFSDVMSALMKDIAILIGVLILMFVLNVKLTLYTIITFPIVLIAVYLFRKFDRKAYDKVRTRISIVNAYLAENISGSLVTKLFNQEKRKKEEFNYISSKLYSARLNQMIVFAIFRPMMNLLFYLTMSLLLWFGSKGIRDSFITFGTLYAFTAYVEMFFKPLFDIAEKYDIMQNAFASAGKIFKLFGETHEELGNAKYKNIQKGEIRFENVKFSYNENENYVLKGASFSIKENERVSIVGETGSGKTTLIKLISGLYKYQEGNIYIDNKKLYDYDIDSIRQKIAVVPQDVFLFSGNIIDNIRLFNENYSDQDVINAAKTVYAHDIIEKLPNSYNTEILERGGTLSSGERQLIALARAVLYNAKIIILDEATANIDVETEDLIQKALDKISLNTTIISIAHRLSTVKSSNRIIVVHKGKIAEEGSHSELMNKKGIYYDLYKLQFENS
ncbi:MAG: ATP-binding cassette, subfamily multidrug efflux pump [Oceanotoga sp.]|uniref:ABC transporter ATP-binding protein n=1 Tax=Oceanotoga sp. TaxID=2108366 RepID=UPI002650D746|nr:ABC transporter ATP-binding protein [Oceanotoga sp.]MDN5342111.1 ATP-binding cassette, subfamily multidrug efflux pump [Oceanotoga sp.]